MVNPTLSLHQPCPVGRGFVPDRPPFVFNTTQREDTLAALWQLFTPLKLSKEPGSSVTQRELQEEFRHFVINYTDVPYEDDLLDAILPGIEPNGGVGEPVTYEGVSIRQHVFIVHNAEMAVVANG